MVYLFEQNTWFHLFPIDGRPHNKGIPTWFGDRDLAGNDLVGREMLQHHHQRAQGIAVRGNDDVVGANTRGRISWNVIRQHARGGVFRLSPPGGATS